MARTNKYASINFNDIYEKKNNINATTKKPSSAPSATLNSQKTHLSAARSHGGMLVLTRPAQKPQPPPPTPIPAQPKPAPVQSLPESDPISLRPLGRTGTVSSPSSSPSPVVSSVVKEPVSVVQPAKPEPFVPPHLRPGFVGREERVTQDGQKQQGLRQREFQGQHHGSPGRYTEDGRPKSGGYERMRRGSGGDSDLPVEMNRPSSGGWYGPYGHRSPVSANHHFQHQQF